MKFFLSKTMILIVLLFCFSKLKAQNIVFKLSDGKDKYDSFFLKSFKNEAYQLFQSKDSIISVSEKSIEQADSVRLYYSFYEETFDMSRIKSGIYFTSNEMNLKAITIKSEFKKKYKYEPKGRRGKVLNSTFKTNLIKTDVIDGRFITGIELNFSKLRWGSNLKKLKEYKDIEKNAKFRLYLALTNQQDTIYLKATKYFTHEFEIDKAGYSYFELNGFDSDISVFEYLIVAIKPLTPNMILNIKKLKSKEKGIYSLNERKSISDGELFFVQGYYLNGKVKDDRSIDFKLHYTK